MGLLIAVETKIVTWNRRAPDDNDDTKMIELVTYSMSVLTVVGARMKSVGIAELDRISFWWVPGPLTS